MKKGGVLEAFLGVLALLIIVGKFLLKALTVIGIMAGIAAIVFALFAVLYSALEGSYYKSKRFLGLKEVLNENTIKFNELNEHIEELKTRYSSSSATDYGTATYSDNSNYKYRRPYLSDVGNNTATEYFCSLSVCRNAQQQPFKYLCKYFNIPIDEDSLNVFESMLNDFSAAEEGKRILIQEREEIKEKHRQAIPFFIRWFGMKRFYDNLGFTKVDMTTTYIPHYSFKYISAGGNSGMTCDIRLDLDNLERFVSFLYSQVELRKTIKYQRALMTERLRKEIKERDHYTCCQCGASLEQEPHLLLEIDHIIPLSKNGMTTYDNLQTLCWRCNRTKSDKLLQASPETLYPDVQ